MHIRTCSWIMLLGLTLGGILSLAQQAPAPAPAPAPSAGPTTAPGPGRDPGGQPGRGQQPGFEQPGRQQQDQMRPFEQRPIFLSGKVMLEDGTPPPESVTIEMVCNGQVRPQAYTDSKGRFSFQVGQQGNVLMDASVSSANSVGPGRNSGGFGGFPSGAGGTGSMGTADFMGCELRASLPGFRSENVMLNRRSMFDNPDVGTIILRHLANVQGTAISFTTLKAPKEAKKSFEKAQKSLQQKPPKHSEAAKELEKAVQIYPEFAAAWNMLGECKLVAKDEEGARQAFEKSMVADSKYTNPYLQLAILDLRASHWKEAAEITSRLTQLNPYIPQAHYFNAIANFNLNKMEQAEKSARSAMDYPRTHHLLGAILARQGNFTSAADEFRTYLKLSPNAAEADQLKRQLTEWEGLGVIQKAEVSPQADLTKDANKEKQKP